MRNELPRPVILTILSAALFLVDCGGGPATPPPKTTEKTAYLKVYNVRSVMTMTKTETGDAAGGALAGAYLAGPLGAMIGANAGADKQKPAEIKPFACQFMVSADKKVFRFTITREYGDDMKACMLLKNEDSAKVTIRITTLADGKTITDSKWEYAFEKVIWGETIE